MCFSGTYIIILELIMIQIPWELISTTDVTTSIYVVCHYPLF